MRNAAYHGSDWIALIGPEIGENLGVRYLASSLNETGFHSEILEFDEGGNFVSVLEAVLHGSSQPIMVALCLSFQRRAADFLSLAVALRERGYVGHITAGGHFAGFAYQDLLRDFPELDSICLHEAEHTIAALAAAVTSGRAPDGIDGLVFRKDDGSIAMSPPKIEEDLSSFPWPDRRGTPPACLGHRSASIVGSRGCYANCAFCCISAWHKLPLFPKPLRLRSVDDIADEMTWLNKSLHREVFVFQDDNFFLPKKHESLERIHSLADALKARGIGKFASVIKARPSDLTAELLDVLKERLGLIRLYVGIETHSPQGISTLRRGISPHQNETALDLVKERKIQACFNMLVFDPDTTIESLETNLSFMEAHAEFPHIFGRVELYAGTPLLSRMLSEGRCRGDYMGYDYRLVSREIQAVFDIYCACFYPRNFDNNALANRLQDTWFQVEVCRCFHPELFEPAWLDEAEGLSRHLMTDSVEVMREIIEFVHKPRNVGARRRFIEQISERLRRCEDSVAKKVSNLEKQIRYTVDHRRQDSHPKSPDNRGMISGEENN